MKQIRDHFLDALPYLATLIFLAALEPFRAFALTNALVQAVLDSSVEAVYGVTRCRDFNLQGKQSYEEYVRQGDDLGLQFHLASATAGILGGSMPSAIEGMMAPSL